MIDIITVTYNSEKWLNGYFNGILAQADFDLDKVNLILFDNNSTDNTVNLLGEYKTKYSTYFNDIVIISSKKNLGFGGGNNKAARHSKFDHLLFLNIDTYLQPDNLKILKAEILKSEEQVGAWELRQMPHEHPKYYDPLTFETSWASAAGLMIRKDIFSKIGGFDTRFFMYCEDVDISWKIRLEKKTIKYLANCKFYHFTYSVLNEPKPTAFVYGIINNLFLRIKFGNKGEIKEWLTLFKNAFRIGAPFKHSRKMLVKVLMINAFKVPSLLFWRFKNRKRMEWNSPKRFIGFDYEITRKGEMYYTILPKLNPLVSVLVRTCNRPTVLKHTLTSLRNQTYKNSEIIVVEDGPNKSEELIKADFSDLNINYYATTNKVGRSVAGNTALERSKGALLCFLDDDDYFYPDYLETMVVQFERNPDLFIVNSMAYSLEIETISTAPYVYNVKGVNLHPSPVFNFLGIASDNWYAIQSIMFRRKVYEELGGFNTDLDYGEDWLFWAKYTSVYPMYSILKVCSAFKIPWETEIKEARIQAFLKYRELLNTYSKQLNFNTNLYTLAELQKENYFYDSFLY